MNKKVIKTSLGTALILSGCILTTIPKSYTRFFDDGIGKDLAYQTEFKNIFAQNSGNLTLLEETNAKSDANLAYFKFSFDRSEETRKDTTSTKSDTYYLEATDGCTITSITGSPTIPTKNISFSKNTGSIKYTNNTATKATVRMTCNVSAVKDSQNDENLDVKVTLKEQMQDEAKYTYNTFSYNEVYPYKPEEEIKPDTNDLEKIYASFRDWVEEISRASNFESVIYNYIMDFYASKEKIDPKTNPNFNKLLGIDIRIGDDGKYTFKIAENLEGYARTADNFSKGGNAFFLSTKPSDSFIPIEEEMNIAFKKILNEYYFESYTDKKKKEAIDNVMNYINAFDGGIKASIDGKVKISGLNVEKETNVTSSVKLLLSDAEKLAVIGASYESPNKIKFDTTTTSSLTTSVEAIKALSKDVITEELNKQITMDYDRDFLTMIAAYYRKTEEYNDYLTFFDKGDNTYVIMNMSSTPEGVATLEFIGKTPVIPEGMNIGFTNKTDELEITITHNNADEINAMKTEFEGFFAGKVPNLTFVINNTTTSNPSGSDEPSAEEPPITDEPPVEDAPTENPVETPTESEIEQPEV